MSKHKKQHFIPKCYLKAWCDPNSPPNQTPYIWIFDRESREGKRKSPDNVFHETDMYTITDESGDRNLKIEHGLSQLESIFTTIRNKKFNFGREISHEEHFFICMFTAAMHARTRCQLDHISDQWRRPLEIADDLAESLKTATEEQKRSMAKTSSAFHSEKKDEFTHEQVREMVENPVGTMLIPMIRTVTPLLARLDFAILCTGAQQGFLTTDSPCVWFDPAAYKRPPLYRAPALMYETIEITLPISPSQCILLNRQGLQGYIDVDENDVIETNRMHRFNAANSYILNSNNVDHRWFEGYVEPDDSWENVNKGT